MPFSAFSNPTHFPLNMSEQKSVLSGIVFELLLEFRQGGLRFGKRASSRPPPAQGLRLSIADRIARLLGANPLRKKKKKTRMKEAHSCHHACLHGTVRKVPT